MSKTPDFAAKERNRLDALLALNVLDTPPEVEFEALVNAAALICDVPISLISLVDEDRQWFKAQVGLAGISETPREVAICSTAIDGDGLFEVHDALSDARFSDNPLIIGEPAIRFYAGVPLKLSDGSQVGTICVIDTQPRILTDTQREILENLAKSAVHALESRKAAFVFSQKEAQLKALTNAAPLGVFFVDLEGGCTYTNERMQTIFGITEAEALGTGWQNSIDLEDSDHVLSQWSRSINVNAKFEATFRIRTKSGVERRVRCITAPAIAQDGAARSHVGSIEDVTEKLRSEAQLNTERLRLGSILEATAVGTWEWDYVSDKIRVNDQWAGILGLSGEGGADCTLAEFRSFINPEDLERSIALLAEHINGGTKAYECELRLRHHDGHWVWVLDRGKIMSWQDGQPKLLFGTYHDITDRKAQQHTLERSERFLERTGIAAGVGGWELDVRTQTLVWSDQTCRIHGFEPGHKPDLNEAINSYAPEARPIIQAAVQEAMEPVESPVMTCLKVGQPVGLAAGTVLISRSGTEFGIEDSAAPILNDAGVILGVVLVFHDVTEARRQSGEMTYRATHDQMTGALNRSEFEGRLTAILADKDRRRGQYALLFIDLDQFKLVNDDCGHSVGDDVLKQVTKIFGKSVRSNDTVARIGGDEFAIILENCEPAQAVLVAQKICSHMDFFRFAHDGKSFRIGTSIGLVSIDQQWDDAQTLIRAADAACIAAKDEGRNRVHVWDQADGSMILRQGEMRWASRLEEALDSGRFVLFAQRIEPAKPRKSGLFLEVLIRLVEPSGALTMPGVFLPAAERFNLMVRIDKWVLDTVFNVLDSMSDLSTVDMVGINISGKSLGDRSFHRYVIEKLIHSGPAISKKLCFEISETAAATNMADVTLFIEQVHRLGVKIALDDFGSGVASFGYLKLLAADYLKIDGQFITNLETDPLCAAAVRCFVDVANVLGIPTIAEFVSSPSLRMLVGQFGVDYNQGYAISQPEPLGQVLGLSF